MNLFLAKSMVVSEMIILNFWYIIVLIVAKSADTWIKANNSFCWSSFSRLYVVVIWSGLGWKWFLWYKKKVEIEETKPFHSEGFPIGTLVKFSNPNEKPSLKGKIGEVVGHSPKFIRVKNGKDRVLRAPSNLTPQKKWPPPPFRGVGGSKEMLHPSHTARN